MNKITSPKMLYEKWKEFVSPELNPDITNNYDAMQMAQILENTHDKNRESIKEYKKLQENNDAGVPISGMQPNLILPLMRRFYPKIMMKNFVSTQTLSTPQAVVHYLERVYKSEKNGVEHDSLFKGFPSVYQSPNFDPFFSSEMVGSGDITAKGINDYFTVEPGTIKYRKESASADSLTEVDIKPQDGDIRRVVVPISFGNDATFTDSECAVNCWLIRGKTIVNEGGLSWGWRLVIKSVLGDKDNDLVEAVRILEKKQEQIVFSVDGDDIKIDVSDAISENDDIDSIESGWAIMTGSPTATAEIASGTRKGYYAINPEKYNHVMAEMSFNIQTMSITLRDRAFKVRYSPKQEKIFQDYLSLNLANELVTIISDQMAYEIDREIKQFIENVVDFRLTEYIDMNTFTTDYAYEPFRGQMEYLFYRINLFAAKMERINKMGRPNVALISPNIAASLNHIKTFELFNDNVSTPAGGVYKMGTVPAKMDFYVDPQMEGDEIVLAHKHSGSPFGCGVVFAPYFTFLTPEIWEGEGGSKTRILQMSYGLDKVPFGELLYGLIKVSNLEGV